MKCIKNKKGFTLVELLAVIVVLAIIMLIAVNSVLPMISDARSGAFTSTVNQVIDTTSTVNLTSQLKGTNYNCYSVSYLISHNYLDKVTAADTTNPVSGLAGFVVVVTDVSTGATTYHAEIKDYSTGYAYKGSVKAANLNAGNPDSGDGDKDGFSSDGTIVSTTCPSTYTPTGGSSITIKAAQ